MKFLFPNKKLFFFFLLIYLDVGLYILSAVEKDISML